MMTKEDSTKIVNCIIPGGRGFCARAWPYKSYRENLLYSHAYIRKNKYIVVMNKERSYTIVNYSWGRDSCARAWPCK